MQHIEDYLGQLQGALGALDLAAVLACREVLEAVRDQGQQVFLCGNGGSAATASHMANDLGKGASYGRDKRFRVVALTDNVSWMTALANDVNYEAIFAEQLENVGQEGDVLLAISGSGNVVISQRQSSRKQMLVMAGSAECLNDLGEAGLRWFVFRSRDRAA